MGAKSRLVRNRAMVGALGVVVALLGAGCSAASVVKSSGDAGVIAAVGAENEYANVMAQIGGRYVKVTSIMSNPNTDPHTFEASTSVAEVVSTARLVVQNGVGYDTFMNSIEAASPDSKRKVIDVQKLLGLRDDHPESTPVVRPEDDARCRQGDRQCPFGSRSRAHARTSTHNLARFDRSLTPWLQAIARFKADYPATPVATTEPVADYMLEAAGTENETPFGLQADIMNGVDPAPQDVTLQNSLLTQHKIRVLLYNQQVTDTITQSFLDLAKRQRRAGGRRVRDDAHSGLRLPDLDAGRGTCSGAGRRPRTVD